LELWYIWVNKSSAMWPTSMHTRVIRFLKNALKKIAGMEIATPNSVTTSA
jgi:hypothetical protein